MALRRYTPPIRRVQEDYSAEVARQWRRARSGPPQAGPKIPDNSEPWMAEPKSVDDLWQIAQWVQERVTAVRSWRLHSSSS